MLPFYKIVVNEEDETGVDFNAFVDAPAHMKGFIAFNENAVRYEFNEEQRIVTGVMISVGTPIYRRDEQFGEHYVVFDEKTVDRICRKFFKKGFNQNVNADHDPNKVIKGATLVSSYIVSNSNPKLPNVPEAFEHMKLMDGSWLASYHIEDDKLWNDVKNGKFNGFSVEGWFDKVKINVNQQMSKVNNQTMADKKETLWNTIKSLFEVEEEKPTFAMAKTADGVEVNYEGEIVEGSQLFVVNGDEKLPAPEGDHELTLEDGSIKIVTLDGSGIVTAVEDFKPEEEVVDEVVVDEMSELRKEVAEAMQEVHRVNDERFSKLEAENKALKSEIKTIREGDKFKANPKGAAANTDRKTLTVSDILKGSNK